MMSAQAKGLKQAVLDLIPAKQKELKEFSAKYGEKELGNVTVSQAIGGARDVKCMFWDVSLLDAQEGIRFRGHTIPELQQKLPAAKAGGEPLPEGLVWLLMTGTVPTAEQAKSVTDELHARAKLPQYVVDAINAFPKHMHPMTQLSSAVLMMQPESKFARAYQAGVHKSKYYESTLEDVLDLMARLPQVAALIYRNTFHGGKPGAAYNKELDYSANLARMMGFTNPAFDEVMRWAP
jgi:citrate synthase